MLVNMNQKGGWHGATHELDKLIEQFLSPPQRMKAHLLANDEKFACPVMEISLLTLAGLVCRFSKTSGGICADTRRPQCDLFHALLGVQGGISGKSSNLWKMAELFPRTAQIVWRTVSLQNMLGRDLARLNAYLTIPQIGLGLGVPVSLWFERHLGVCGEDYMAVANSLHGAALLRADIFSLLQRCPELERRMLPLINLCSTTPDNLASLTSEQLKLDSSDLDAINEAQLLADVFFRFPILQIDGMVLCISSQLLFNRLHRGLHYLVTESYQGDGQLIQQVRAECGRLFERYILWLLEQFLPNDKVQIFHSFRIRPAGKLQKGVEPPERDIAIIVGKRALVFEIKSAIPNLDHRRRADVADFVNLFSHAVKQVVSSSNALLQGTAFQDAALTKQLPQVDSVIPCVVCFEPLPLRFPLALEVEAEISDKIQSRPFECESGRLPVQIFDVEGIEGFGDQFGLPSEWELLLNAIAKRSSAAELRYTPISRGGGVMPDGEHQGSSTLPKLFAAAEQVSMKRWRELTLECVIKWCSGLG
jgi:hypothetical protein